VAFWTATNTRLGNALGHGEAEAVLYNSIHPPRHKHRGSCMLKAVGVLGVSLPCMYVASQGVLFRSGPAPVREGGTRQQRDSIFCMRRPKRCQLVFRHPKPGIQPYSQNEHSSQIQPRVSVTLRSLA